MHTSVIDHMINEYVFAVFPRLRKSIIDWITPWGIGINTHSHFHFINFKLVFLIYSIHIIIICKSIFGMTDITPSELLVRSRGEFPYRDQQSIY